MSRSKLYLYALYRIEMGCDFYTFYEVCFYYIVGDRIEEESYEIPETRERHYFWDDVCVSQRKHEYDSDFEEYSPEDHMKKRQISQEQQIQDDLRKYSTKGLFANGKWLCLDSAKAKYEQIAKELEIPLDSIVSVVKKGGYELR